MRSTFAAAVLIFLVACDNPTRPVVPPNGQYALDAGASSAQPVAQAQWTPLPFEYNVLGNEDCILPVTAGSLQLQGNSYSLDISLGATCPYVMETALHEQGTFTTDGGTLHFDTHDPQNPTWIESARGNATEVDVSIGRPLGGLVNYLRFRLSN